MRDNCNVI